MHQRVLPGQAVLPSLWQWPGNRKGKAGHELNLDIFSEDSSLLLSVPSVRLKLTSMKSEKDPEYTQPRGWPYDAETRASFNFLFLLPESPGHYFISQNFTSSQLNEIDRLEGMGVMRILSKNWGSKRSEDLQFRDINQRFIKLGKHWLSLFSRQSLWMAGPF